jgi:acetyl esterase/lipase
MVSNGSRCRSLGGAWGLLLGLLLSARPATAPAQSRPPVATSVHTVRDLDYGREGSTAGDPLRRLDLYLPTASGPPLPPLLVYIHGGAWVSGDRRQYAPLGLALASQGAAVAIINYRLSGDGPEAIRHPAHAQDAAAAIAWLHKNAKSYGYDPARIFVGGHSAGAHISALLAYDGGLLSAVGVRPESIRGYVGIEGIYDLPQLVRRFPAYRTDFLQLAFGADETAWRSASPQQLLADSAHKRPWLLVHSRQDELVDIEQSRNFQKGLEKQGIPVRFLGLERGSHFGVVGELSTPRSALCLELLTFLGSEPVKR